MCPLFQDSTGHIIFAYFFALGYFTAPENWPDSSMHQIYASQIHTETPGKYHHRKIMYNYYIKLQVRK